MDNNLSYIKTPSRPADAIVENINSEENVVWDFGGSFFIPGVDAYHLSVFINEDAAKEGLKWLNANAIWEEKPGEIYKIQIELVFNEAKTKRFPEVRVLDGQMNTIDKYEI